MLGQRVGVHVEVFASDRVLLLTAGIGGKPPRAMLDGRITPARCYGTLTRHAEVVLEVGPHVPPHPSYAFPAGT